MNTMGQNNRHHNWILEANWGARSVNVYLCARVHGLECSRYR
ncbi:hypothetical protein XENTR_v10015805 [Xenopus tropicalis]|nr:hypothetical protein XENTR_v10015805 [Xenopus tropicalis]